MKRKSLLAVILFPLFAMGQAAAPDSAKQDWTNYVRIGAYGLKGGDAVADRAPGAGERGVRD